MFTPKNYLDNSFSISVVIPTFNRLIYLERAIKSVLNQTISVNEIIIVDDGSDDGTSEFIHSNYPNLKYIFLVTYLVGGWVKITYNNYLKCPHIRKLYFRSACTSLLNYVDFN